VGTLFVAPTRGQEIFSFEYADTWLRLNSPLNLDPNFELALAVAPIFRLRPDRALNILNEVQTAVGSWSEAGAAAKTLIAIFTSNFCKAGQAGAGR
jgi:hypothetical protein